MILRLGDGKQCICSDFLDVSALLLNGLFQKSFECKKL